MIGIIGNGVVGQRIDRFYSIAQFQTKVYDIDRSRSKNSLETLVSECSVIFVCVPTPTVSGSQDSSHIEQVFHSLNTLNFLGLVILKSTVVPGTSRRLSETYLNLNIAHSPEFLNVTGDEKDILKAPQIIYGFQDFSSYKKWESLINKISKPIESSKIITCLYEESEIIKYACNVFYAVKNTYFNLLRLACENLQIDFNLVREVSVQNGWIHPMHTFSPGRDGLRGFSGMCLPKDLKAFMSWCSKRDLPYDLFIDVENLNTQFREMPMEEEQTNWEKYFYGQS